MYKCTSNLSASCMQRSACSRAHELGHQHKDWGADWVCYFIVCPLTLLSKQHLTQCLDSIVKGHCLVACIPKFLWHAGCEALLGHSLKFNLPRWSLAWTFNGLGQPLLGWSPGWGKDANLWQNNFDAGCWDEGLNVTQGLLLQPFAWRYGLEHHLWRLSRRYQQQMWRTSVCRLCQDWLHPRLSAELFAYCVRQKPGKTTVLKNLLFESLYFAKPPS